MLGTIIFHKAFFKNVAWYIFVYNYTIIKQNLLERVLHMKYSYSQKVE